VAKLFGVDMTDKQDSRNSSYNSIKTLWKRRTLMRLPRCG